MSGVPSLNEVSPEERDWFDAYLDGTITPDELQALEQRLLSSPPLRAALRRYLSLDNALQEVSGELPESTGEATAAWIAPGQPPEAPPGRGTILSFPRYGLLAAAAGLAFLLGWGLMARRTAPGDPTGGGSAESARVEPSAEGFAAIGKLHNARWSTPGTTHREGDTLGAESLELASGTAQIQFYSGATMTIEGPAEITIKSAWEATCREGAVRMQVPPPARGFKLHAPSTEIVDLGTEFGLVVRDGTGHVEVFDGEIAVRHRDADETLLREGAALELAPDRDATPATTGSLTFPDVQRLGLEAGADQRSSFARWQAHRDALARDERLIAYYGFDRDSPDALVPNLAIPANPELNGAVVLAEPVAGRWPGLKSALEFRRPGSRVRVNIPGEFEAFTFMCWVRIDSLDRWYNALFMGDGYENGEPHWQIRDDGKLMLSVMVDHERPHPNNKDSRFHHIYYSPPMWDLSMSGQWLHLASVFDPANRVVTHHLNGERISSEPITSRFLVESLRIGNGEIGNWGQPFREDPEFRIRNLNGRMDEMAIFRAALGDEEIRTLYQRSRAGSP